METDQQIVKAHKTKNNLKIGAKVALVILLLNVVGHLATVYQTRYQLVSPLIPESTISEINKQFIFHAIVWGNPTKEELTELLYNNEIEKFNLVPSLSRCEIIAEKLMLLKPRVDQSANYTDDPNFQ